MMIDNSLILWGLKERLEQLNYIQINNDNQNRDFSNALHTHSVNKKWNAPNCCYYIKPHDDFTTCVAILNGSENSTETYENEDEIYMFQQYCLSELGDLYDNLKLVTVIITDKTYRHLKGLENTLVINRGKIVRKFFFNSELRADLKAIESCRNYARARMYETNFNIFDSFFGGYREKAIYWICLALIVCYWNMDVWGLSPLSVNELFYQKNVFSLISYMFMHGSLMHLIGNLVVLFIVGRSLEQKVGSIKFSIIFLGGGIISGLLATAYRFDTSDPIATVGCSGAVFACIGAWIVVSCYDFTYKELNLLNFIIDTLVGIGYIYLCSKTEDVDNAVHIAGFGCGMFVAILTENIERIAKDELSFLGEKFIVTKDAEFNRFLLSPMDKAKSDEYAKEQKDYERMLKDDERGNTESEWVRI